MKKQIITVLVLGAIAAMPFSAAVSAAESAPVAEIYNQGQTKSCRGSGC